MESKDYDLVLCGAGATGLASAWQIVCSYPSLKVLIIEKEPEVAFHQTGNNSGVIHSGIYYKPGGSKALNCKKGYHYLLDFCREHDVPHDVCGKVIVAVNEAEIDGLNRIYERGQLNGLKGLQLLDGPATQEIEPHVECLQSIYVPQSGIVDYKVMAVKMKELLEERGVRFAFGEEVKSIEQNNRIKIHTGKSIYVSKYMINCAGLYADKLAQLAGFETPFRIIPFRGEYYEFKPAHEYLVKHLIYPVPDPNFPFLGVHFTRMQRGGIEAGPNAVLALKKEGYHAFDFDAKEFLEIMGYPGTIKLGLKHWRKGIDEYYRSFSKQAFVQTLKRMIPKVEAHMFKRGGSGVRAQAIDKEGNLLDDFLIVSNESIINLCNAPSPAATSCLAIGEMIRDVFSKMIE